MEICLSLVHKPIIGNFLFTLLVKNPEKKKSQLLLSNGINWNEKFKAFGSTNTQVNEDRNKYSKCYRYGPG